MYTTPIYEFRGIPEALKVLGYRQRRLENFREPLMLLKNDFFVLQRGWLDSEGRAAWEPLKPRYLAWKVKKVGNKPMLQLTGDMYADLTGENDAGVRSTSSSLT